MPELVIPVTDAQLVGLSESAKQRGLSVEEYVGADVNSLSTAAQAERYALAATNAQTLAPPDLKAQYDALVVQLINLTP